MTKNTDEEPEEEKKDQFDDDEDFGLPDLDYDELDDDDDSSSDSEVEEPKTEEPTTSENIFSSDTDESTDTDSQPEPEEEPKAEEEGLFYEEETYDEFQDTSSQEAVFGSDSDSSTTNTGYTPSYQVADDSEKGKFTRVVVIGALLFAVAATAFWFINDSYEGTEEVVEAEPVEEIIPEDTITVVEEPIIEEPEPTGSQANVREPGEITVLQQRTGKSYIVIASFFDEDLANDYAQKLSDAGKSPMIIPPYSSYRFHRVAIAEFDSFEDAKSSVGNFKGEYGESVWPLRY